MSRRARLPRRGWTGLAGLVLLSGLHLGCATTVGPEGIAALELAADRSLSFPVYTGPKRKIQVVQISVPVEEIKRYPDLADKRVGFGLSNLLVETLFDTGRFEFLEEKGELLKRLVELWELTGDGILVKDPATARTELQAPDFLVYAEVFDFSPCSPVETLMLSSKALTCVTSVGVQVRIGNTATGEYVPGSSDPLSPEGKYVHTIQPALFGSAKLPFDQSAVGKATLKATRYAVVKALERFDTKNW